MKNVLIYVSPNDSFDNDHPSLINDAPPLIKVQLDNSLKLGWKPKDILLFTNFNFQYGIIKAKVIKDFEYCKFSPRASKIDAIIKLFEHGLIKKKQLYWFHDLDAFELNRISPQEINIKDNEIALTDYGRMPRWSTGTIFFRSGSADIFKKIKKVVYADKLDEERALEKLTNNLPSIRKRVKKINKSYNFTAFNLKSCYQLAIKPIRVVHFHPTAGIKQLGINRSLDYFMGNNEIKTPIVSPRLYKMFRYHGIR